MAAPQLNGNTYFRTVGTSSVSITLSSVDLSSVSPSAGGYNVLVSNTGAASVFVVGGIGSAATAVYPTDSETAVSTGRIVPAGQALLFDLRPGVTHISMISTAAGNGVGISVGL